MLDLLPMKISESIEAHMSAAVAAISQRNQATLPGHLILIPVHNVFNHLAKAFGFCLSFFRSFDFAVSGACPELVDGLRMTRDVACELFRETTYA